MASSEDEELSRALTRPDLPAPFERRQVTLAPGEECALTAPEWTDTLVLVQSGAVEVICTGNQRHRFRGGDVLTLAGLRLTALRNVGDGEVMLLAVRRSTAGQDRAPLGKVTT